MKILLVDDEPRIERLVRDMVVDAGYEFAYAENGAEALRIIEECKPDLVIMDVMMPKVDGFTACRELRAKGITTPVIFLSAKGDIVDKGVGFAAGGDDYMVKPFDPRELLMHIEALLRRAHMQLLQPSSNSAITLGRLELDMGQHRMLKDGKVVPLTPKEFNIMSVLAHNPGVVFSREQLVEAVWGPEFVGETSSITVFIKKLRAKVEDDPTQPLIIETVWGIGYRINPDEC
ncbi:response regulator transcription factor [Adlercreutzia agrestimuris]|uniref:response regulator transcription factor n=1 Tax=Adlercreutzia agrestimuris TaxID=2941324 RepID=UPI00203FDB56|nr:response regulator transcription factor [Adlercreutzia agrestimuris]